VEWFSAPGWVMAMQRFATAIDAATSITTINIERLAIAIYGISAIIFVAIYLAKTWRRP
jgi:hypothetical protein